MSCRCFFRLIVCVLLIAMAVATVLALIGSFAERTIKKNDNSTTTITISFANIDVKNTTKSGKATTTRTHTRDLACKKARTHFIAGYALLVVSAIVGCLNVLLSLVWLMAPCGCPFGIIVFIFTALSLAGTIAPFVLIAKVITTAPCSDALSVAIASDVQGPLIGKMGFVVLLIAIIGLFITLVIQFIGCFCGCQLARSRGEKARDTTIEGYDRSHLYTDRTSSYQGTEMSGRPFKK